MENSKHYYEGCHFFRDLSLEMSLKEVEKLQAMREQNLSDKEGSDFCMGLFSGKIVYLLKTAAHLGMRKELLLEAFNESVRTTYDKLVEEVNKNFEETIKEFVKSSAALK